MSHLYLRTGGSGLFVGDPAAPSALAALPVPSAVPSAVPSGSTAGAPLGTCGDEAFTSGVPTSD